MKKVLSTILVCVLIVGSLLALSSCGRISGTYEGSLNLGFAAYTVTYSFNGNNVEITSQLTSQIGSLNPSVVNATYVVEEKEDGTMTITFDYGDAEAADGMEEGGVALPFAEGTENGETYIKIAGIKYIKK